MLYRKFLLRRLARDALTSLVIGPKMLWASALRPVVLLITLVSIVSLLTAYMPDVMPQSVIMQRVHPQLRRIAQDRPHQLLTVIVKKSSADASVERSLVKLGGVIKRNMPLLNAFAAELSGRAVLRLASNSDVKWIAMAGIVIRTDSIDLFSLSSPHADLGRRSFLVV